MKNKLENFKRKISKITPFAEEIDIRMTRDHHGCFVSRVKIHLPRKKNLFVLKKAETYRECLEKTKQAVFKQIKKEKNRFYTHKPKQKPKDILAYTT